MPPESVSSGCPQFISLEGLNGAGKSAALEEIVSVFEDLNVPFFATRDQLSTSIGKDLRQILLHQGDHLDSNVESLLSAAARRQNFVENIQPQLSAGKSIIAERYTDSIYAYGFARSVSPTLLSALAEAVGGSAAPSLTLLLDLTPEQALERIPPEARHRVEREPLEFHHRLRQGYLTLACAYPERIRVIDASQAKDQVMEKIRSIMLERIK